jgi:diguanylate cyclase (GGDEF)-like protein
MMPVWPTPDDQSERRAAVRELAFLHSPAEERFDRITRLVARALGAPVALLTFVSDDVQWIKSTAGSDAAEAERIVASCAQVIDAADAVAVSDATGDERFASLVEPGVEPDVGAYAGHPVRAGADRVGTLCVVDRVPRAFDADDIAALRDFAALVETEFQRGVLSEVEHELLRERDELQRQASIDPLTHLFNRSAIMDVLDRELARARRGAPMALAMFDIDFFKNVNDRHGHLAGDDVLREVAARVASSIRDVDAAGRYGGDEFLIVLGNCSERAARSVAERICANIAEAPFAVAGGLAVTVSVGVATYGPATAERDAFVAAADRALYAAKAAGRNRIEIAAAE